MPISSTAPMIFEFLDLFDLDFKCEHWLAIHLSFNSVLVCTDFCTIGLGDVVKDVLWIWHCCLQASSRSRSCLCRTELHICPWMLWHQSKWHLPGKLQFGNSWVWICTLLVEPFIFMKELDDDSQRGTVFSCHHQNWVFHSLTQLPLLAHWGIKKDVLTL